MFASLTSILGKVGIEGVESNLGTAIRTGVVLVMAWLIVFVKGKQHTLKEVPKKELGFICLSGLATGGSWLCYYKALQDGLASVVVPIDKLSILVSIAFSAVVFHERLSRKGCARPRADRCGHSHDDFLTFSLISFPMLHARDRTAGIRRAHPPHSRPRALIFAALF